ncbi:MAG: tetratricopeptide repeat protein [Gemmatimonadetes bacterium]|nr:tetratricopeptide repeat protein [Gemmatimonadota bacterium]MYE93585.1 tetratricopeptide repeat protein [Gemmatimonadota bacterium]MYJ10845.1 tetratricopeptide repeat protein [Gemmatimonadota bacterium]
MSTSPDVPLPRSPAVRAIRSLFERRVFHAVGIYAGASWGLIEFADAIVVQRLLFSTHYVDLVLWAMPLLLPSVFMLAWFHGKPGRDRDTLARTEKVGIPANLVLCGVVLWISFGDKDLGRMTTVVSTTDEEGQAVEREVVKPEFRKSVALFPFDLGPGSGDGDTWLAYAVPFGLELDLLADDFFIAKGGLLDRREALFRNDLVERGFANLRGVPLTLKREVGEGAYAEFLIDGEIDHTRDLYQAVLRVYRVADGSLEGETVHEGTDLLALLDELSVSVKEAIGIPTRAGVEDIPVRQRLSDDDAAVEELFRGLEAAFVKADLPAAIELAASAAARDPTFTAAQYVLSLCLSLAMQPQSAVASMEAAVEGLYRFPERVRLGVRGDYYALLGDWEKMAAVYKMWTELSPDDLLALVNYKEALDVLGDREGVLVTLETMREIDPRNGELLKKIARVHEELGDAEQALAVMADYVESFSEDATGYAGLAALQKRLGDYEAARDNLETAILLEPLSASFAAELASLDLDAGNFAEAWAGYQRALETARTPEQRAGAFAGIAKYHLRRGEVMLAVGATGRLLEQASGHPSPLDFSNTLAGLLFDFVFAGHASDVAAVAETLNDPQTGVIVMLFTTVESGGAEVASGIYRMFEASLEAEGDDIPDPTRLRLIGSLAEGAGDHASASEYYLRAMALDRSLNVHVNAGRALRLAGLLDKSEAELTEALRLGPGDPRAHFEMALLLEAQGDLDGAVEHLRSALTTWESADEDYEPARQARAALEELER